MRLPILGSPTLPAPTTRHCLPVSFINIGNKLVTVSSRYMRYRSGGTYWRHITQDRVDRRTRQKVPQFGITVLRKELPEVLALRTRRKILPQQSFDRLRNLSRKAAISYGPRGRLMQAKRSAQTKVISIDEP